MPSLPLARPTTMPLTTPSRLTDVLSSMSRAEEVLSGGLRPIIFGFDAVRFGLAFHEDGNHVGSHTLDTGGSIAGGFVGSLVGRAVGMPVGEMLGAGMGAVVGGPLGALAGVELGGALGSFAGSLALSYAGSRLGEHVSEQFQST